MAGDIPMLPSRRPRWQGETVLSAASSCCFARLSNPFDHRLAVALWRLPSLAKCRASNVVAHAASGLAREPRLRKNWRIIPYRFGGSFVSFFPVGGGFAAAAGFFRGVLHAESPAAGGRQDRPHDRPLSVHRRRLRIGRRRRRSVGAGAHRRTGRRGNPAGRRRRPGRAHPCRARARCRDFGAQLRPQSACGPGGAGGRRQLLRPHRRRRHHGPRRPISARPPGRGRSSCRNAGWRPASSRSWPIT